MKKLKQDRTHVLQTIGKNTYRK